MPLCFRQAPFKCFQCLKNENEIIGNFPRNIATLELYTQQPVQTVGNTVKIHILLNISEILGKIYASPSLPPKILELEGTVPAIAHKCPPLRAEYRVESGDYKAEQTIK